MAAFVCLMATRGASAQIVVHNRATALTHADTGEALDYMHATPMPIPQPAANPHLRTQSDLLKLLSKSEAKTKGIPGMVPGGTGSGVESPEDVGTPPPASGIVKPFDFGTSNYPFTTSQADLDGMGTNADYPYRAAGKLFFNIGNQTFVCSASLIGRGIVVTAAHCVAGFGQQKFYSGWQFMPGYRNGTAPFAKWAVQTAWVLNSYLGGTDGCSDGTAICEDDVALLVLKSAGPPTAPVFAGDKTGWYGWGYDGAGFAPGAVTQITQLGYSVDLDGGNFMERTDSQGFTSASMSNNTIIGSLMTGGASGGPWLVNFGTAPVVSGGLGFGGFSNYDVVVGVTGWSYSDSTIKQEGASPFTSGNIVELWNLACAAAPSNCSGTGS